MKHSAHSYLLFTPLLQCLEGWNKLQVLLAKALQLATFHCGLYQLLCAEEFGLQALRNVEDIFKGLEGIMTYNTSQPCLVTDLKCKSQFVSAEL